MDIEKRKDDHLAVCARPDVRSPSRHSLDRIRLEYDALPEIDLEDVETGCRVLGRDLAAPILVGAMTGGSALGGEVNRTLAEACARVGIGMCLGSQRAMLERPELASTYDVRAAAPGIPLVVGNLGAVQLNRGVTAAAICSLGERVSMDALAFHLNPLQEAIQPGGDTVFAGITSRLEEVIPSLPWPVIVKEVGAGLSSRTARKLARLDIAGVEAAGVGGTSWAMVEAIRAGDGPAGRAGRRLAWFGVETAEAIRSCREAFPDRLVIGSGGVETGYHAAVAIALGADAVAITGPMLAAARRGVEAVVDALLDLVLELRIVMFCCGVSTPAELRSVGRQLEPGVELGP